MKELIVFALLCTIGFALVKSHPTPGGEESDLVNKRAKRALKTNAVELWSLYQEDGKYIIPYVLKVEDESHNATELMELAVADYHRYTCLRFQPRTTEEVFVTIRFMSRSVKYGASIGCGQTVMGHYKYFNWVTVDVGCPNPVNTLMHELHHKILFQHEHVRPERDDYVRSRTPQYGSSASPFDKVKVTRGYDIFSISHYNLYQLKHPKDTLWPRVVRLSHDDIQAVNFYYKCPDTLEGRGCYKSALPTLVGAGSFYPMQEIYETMQAVRLICDNGYLHEIREEPDSSRSYDEAYSYCENGQFTPRTLTCKKVECKDQLSNCGELRRVHEENPVFENPLYMPSRSSDLCDNGMMQILRKPCLKECGYCGEDGSVCTQYPPVYGYGQIARDGGEFKMYYKLNGEKVSVVCDEGFTPVGPTITTCTNGRFDVEKFQCVAPRPPTKLELCSRVDDATRIPTKNCSRLELDVGPGRFVPDQGCYHNRAFVQLVCDEGFHPETSDVAQCQDGKWIHTDIKCVPFHADECVDTSDECKDYKLQGLCDSSEMIGFMRNRCKQSCGWCGGCQGSPIFDRMKAALSPIKFSYENGETTTIQCFPGWRQIPGESSSQCRNGTFHPPALHCKPIDEVCVYSAGMFGSDRESVTPSMIHYPSGSTLNVRCAFDSQQEYQVQCENGHFVPENFTCPEDDRDRTTCALVSLYLDSLDMKVEILRYNTDLKETYEDGEQIEVKCNYTSDQRMTVTCHDGLFSYTNVCSKEVAKKECYMENLPTVYGNGVIEPIKPVYEDTEDLVLRCANGSSSVTQRPGVSCNNGRFSATSLICSEDDCSDISLDCEAERCDDEDVRRRCRRTCGVCMGAGCSGDSVGESARPDIIKDMYRDGETISVICHLPSSPGRLTLVTSECVNGKFDRPLPLCTEYDVDDQYYDKKQDFFGFLCPSFMDCTNKAVRWLCGRTCPTRLAAAEAEERQTETN